MSGDKMVHTEVVVRKAPDDPACTRVSCGGAEKIGYYVTYRGSVEDAAKVLRLALMTLEVMAAKKIEAPLDTSMRSIGEQGRS